MIRSRPFPLPDIEYRDALISPGGTYRYWLERRWSGADANSPYVLWCMLNPSTADAHIDDPTLRRVVGFSDSWGFGRAIVVNLYAYRATNPAELRKLDADYRAGPQNEYHIEQWLGLSTMRMFVCAWGGNRIDPVPDIIQNATRYYLMLTRGGEPSHPLYLPGNLLYPRRMP
jgi:hypothetical protein